MPVLFRLPHVMTAPVFQRSGTATVIIKCSYRVVMSTVCVDYYCMTGEYSAAAASVLGAFQREVGNNIDSTNPEGAEIQAS
jgi:hypothetical protein